MNFRQKYRLDAMRRGQNFLDTNTAALGTINSSGARAELDDAVTQLTAQGNNQEANRVGAQGTTSEVGALRNTLRQTHMRPIAQVAKVRLTTVPQFSALTLPDPRIDTQGLIQAANAMATAATPYQSIFTGLGLPSDFIPQLQSSASALQAAIDTRSEYKVSGVGATSGASAEIQRGRHALDLLDSLVVPQLAGNATLLASWKNAIRVVNKPGVTSKGSAPAPVPAPAFHADPITPSAAVPVTTIGSPVEPVTRAA